MEQTAKVQEDSFIGTVLGMALPITVLQCQFQSEVEIFGVQRPFWKVVYTQKYGRRWTYEIIAILIEEKIVICPYIAFQVKPEAIEQMVNNSLYAAVSIAPS